MLTKISPASLTAALGTLLFALVFVVGTGVSEGLSMAQRVMTDMAMPVGLAWLMAFAGTLYHFRSGNRRAAGGFSLGFLALWVLFCPLVGVLVIHATEAPPVIPAPISAEAPHYDIVVVLGGGASRNRAGHAELASSGERLALAAKLWHAGKVETIICTGSARPRPRGDSADRQFDTDDPAEIGREILVALGVPEHRIFRSGGENTAAEMQHLSDFFKNPPQGVPDGDRLGLITSAFHIPRAMRLALSEGHIFDPLPAGTRAPARNDRGIGILVPNAATGEVMATVAKEWLARVIGR